MLNQNKNPLDKLLTLFVSEDNIKPILSTPIRQGEYVYATDGRIIVRIKANMLDGEYTPNVSSIYFSKPYNKITTNCNLKLSIKQLEDALSAIKQIDEEIVSEEETTCDECNGSGEVEWEYKAYTEYYDCPVCHGSGLLEEEKRVKTGKKVFDPNAKIRIGKAVFRAYYISIIVEAMKQAGENILLCDCQNIDSGNHFILGTSGIEIILMPFVNTTTDYEINL